MEKLYYVSQGETPEEHLQNIENVGNAGIKLVQLRLKNVTKEEYLETAIKARAICEYYNATLIINDNLEIAEKMKLGVHLGKEDVSISKAKTILKNGLIGGTANTFEDCLKLIHQRVDYIGLGPFRYTETKKNLSPVLGLSGYEKIISDLRMKGYQTPIYAIGGIVENDFQSLLNIGVNGIAVSGLLSNKNLTSVIKIAEKF